MRRCTLETNGLKSFGMQVLPSHLLPGRRLPLPTPTLPVLSGVGVPSTEGTNYCIAENGDCIQAPDPEGEQIARSSSSKHNKKLSRCREQKGGSE